MAGSIMVGAGAGRWFEPGEVYVMKDVTGQIREGCKDEVQMFKIGFSKDPQERLKQIQKDLEPNTIKLLGSFEALESNGAETAAQKAVKEKLGLKKDSGRGNATDWFVNPLGKSEVEICSVVEQAVKQHNEEEKKKQKKEQKQK